MILLAVWTVSSYFGGMPSLFILCGGTGELLVEAYVALEALAEWRGR